MRDHGQSCDGSKLSQCLRQLPLQSHASELSVRFRKKHFWLLECTILKVNRCGVGDLERSAYIAVMLGPMHCTPCHASSQGSPPVAAQPRRSGEPSETYSLFTASTASTKPEENRTYVTCIVLQGSTKFYQILLTVLLIGVGRCKEGDGEREHLGIRML
jgi:hypothetical protein